MRTVLFSIENGQFIDHRPEAERNRDGENIVAMCRDRRPPAVHGTDNMFTGMESLDPFHNTREHDKIKLAAQAKAMGVSLAGKRYMASLVRPEYRGRFDPEALVDSRNDVKARLQERGWGTDPEHDCMVKVKAREYEGPDPLDQPYAPDDTLVHSHVQNELETAGVEKISKKEYRKIFEKKKTQLTGDVNDG